MCVYTEYWLRKKNGAATKNNNDTSAHIDCLKYWVNGAAGDGAGATAGV